MAGLETVVGRRVAMDCGQSGVRIRIDGRVLDRDLPPIHTDSQVLPQVARTLEEALHGVGIGPHASLAAGITGLTATQTQPAELHRLTEHLGIESVSIAHDSVTAYLAANGLALGTVAAVGTGVVTLGVGRTGTQRVDGWGHLLGDAGSAYWIGRRGLDVALRAYDGRGEPTTLRQSAEYAFGPLPEMYMRLQADPQRVSRIAEFARHVAASAHADDPVAKSILAEAGAELALAAQAALIYTCLIEGPADLPGDHIPPDYAPRVSWVGAVLSHNDIVRDAFCRRIIELAPTVQVAAPLGTPLDGAGALGEVPGDHPLAGSISHYRG